MHAPDKQGNCLVGLGDVVIGEGAGLIEIVITALFVLVIVSVTSPRAPAGFAPIAIGLALVLFHLVAIPVSNASPSR